MGRRRRRGGFPGRADPTDPRSYTSLYGIYGGANPNMSATAFQRKRRELREQTSVSARMNEEGQYDPYAKADANYDAVGVKDTGEEHQQGNPPPYSLTPHVPEELHEASKAEGAPEDLSAESYREETDEGARQQEENDPPLTSVELRDGEEAETIEAPDVEGKPDLEEYADQRRYDATDGRRAYPDADHSLENVDLASPEPDLDVSGRPVESNATPAARAKAEELGVDVSQVEGTGKDGRVTVSDVEKASK